MNLAGRFHNLHSSDSNAEGLDLRLSQGPTKPKQTFNQFCSWRFIIPFRVISWERKAFLLMKRNFWLQSTSDKVQIRLGHNWPPAVTSITVFCYLGPSTRYRPFDFGPSNWLRPVPKQDNDPLVLRR